MEGKIDDTQNTECTAEEADPDKLDKLVRAQLQKRSCHHYCHADNLMVDGCLCVLLLFQSRADSFEDMVHPFRLTCEGPLKDLSAWRVTIPEVIEKKQELENNKRNVHYFVIEVRRIDVLESRSLSNIIKSVHILDCDIKLILIAMCKYVYYVSNIKIQTCLSDDFESSNWRVERRYPDFYVLEQKLVEFHGDFEGTHLPPKKSFGTKNKDFLDSKIQSFEQYLQVIVQHFQ